MNLFTGKTFLITGGIGSFGNAVLNRFLTTDIGKICIFSRDEKRHPDRVHYQQYPLLFRQFPSTDKSTS